MNIHIENLTININQPQESVQEKPAAPVFAERSPVRRGHRIEEEAQLKSENARLNQQVVQERSNRLQLKHRITARLRRLFGADVANSVMAGCA